MTALANTGAGANELKELARHSDVRLTLGIYTHTKTEALAAAVARLPVPGEAAPNPFAAYTRAELEAAVVALWGLVVALVAPGVAPELATGRLSRETA